VLALLFITALSSPDPVRATEPVAGEIRGMWVLRTSLTTPARIDALVRSAREHGFNTLLVQVRGRGDAYFTGGIEPRASELQLQPASFDPLATVVASAHAVGLRVHAWVNVNLVSSAAELPAARAHLVYRHPDWLMVPREIAQEVAKIPTDSPAYVGKLARWTRAQPEVEGLYSSPIAPASAAYTESVVRDLATRYAVDGVHFDYARYPSDTFDYSRASIGEFRASMRARISPVLQRELDDRETVDLFAYPDALPDAWRAFRVERMTMLMERLSGAVKAARPGALVTVATKPEAREALERRLQDWSAWLSHGLVDAVCPMAYTQEPERFAEQIAAVREAAGTRALWAGIGAYRLTAKETIDNIQTARRLGANGIVLFSYDSLIDPRQSSPDYLETVGRAVFAAARAGSTGSK
jgi:uncharacterized lipoprotein YddW (UPF0748 family)